MEVKATKLINRNYFISEVEPLVVMDQGNKANLHLEALMMIIEIMICSLFFLIEIMIAINTNLNKIEILIS